MYMFAFASEPGPIDLFWFPMSIFALGMMLRVTRNPEKMQKMGIILAIIGLIFVTISPFTIPESPSSDFGQLILFLIGPSISLTMAILITINFPNTKNNLKIKTFFMILGLSWIILIWIFNPQFNNKFLLKWFVSVEIFSAVFLFSISYYQSDIKARVLFILLGILMILFNEESLGIPNASRSLFIETSGIIIGTSGGIIFGILIWFYIIQTLHSLEKDLTTDDELSEDEREMLIGKLNDDLNWLESNQRVD